MSKFQRGDLLVRVSDGVQCSVLSTPNKRTNYYTYRTYGLPNDGETHHIHKGQMDNHTHFKLWNERRDNKTEAEEGT